MWRLGVFRLAVLAGSEHSRSVSGGVWGGKIRLLPNRHAELLYCSVGGLLGRERRTAMNHV